VRAPIRVDRIQAYSTREPQPSVLLCEAVLRDHIGIAVIP